MNPPVDAILTDALVATRIRLTVIDVDLTLQTCPTGLAGTLITVDAVMARPVVLAGFWQALINIKFTSITFQDQLKGKSKKKIWKDCGSKLLKVNNKHLDFILKSKVYQKCLVSLLNVVWEVKHSWQENPLMLEALRSTFLNFHTHCRVCYHGRIKHWHFWDCIPV